MRIFVYPWDLLDEGVEKTLRRIKSWGFESVAVAASYHNAKLFLPHNPKRKVFFPEEGSVYYHVATERYRNYRIRPYESNLVKEYPDLWKDIALACERIGLSLIAWVVCLHNSFHGKNPAFCIRNVYGNLYPFNLCPANPDVRQYISGLIEEVSSLPGVKEVFIEALHYMDFEHDYEHEMTGTYLSPKSKSLLGFCFCDACISNFEEHGISIQMVRNFIYAQIEREITEPLDLNGEILCEWMLENPMIQDVINVRSHIVTTLVKQIQEYSKVPIIYFTPGPEQAWSNGIDLSQIKSYVDRFEIHHYNKSLEGLPNRVDRMMELIGSTPLRIILRAGYPDVLSADELNERVDKVNQLTIDGVSLYNYGQVPLHYWVTLGKNQTNVRGVK